MVGAYKGTAGGVLEKKAAVSPLRIRLEHVPDVKRARILIRVNHKNFFFEKKEKMKKKKKKQ